MILKNVKALDDFLDQTTPLWNAHGEQPAPNSKAALELVNYERPKSIQTAYSQASLLFEAAADYTWALVKTFTEPALTVAPWVCPRGVLITSAKATWLWDVKINARKRAERSLAFRCEGLRQQIDLAQASMGKLDVDYAFKRLKEVEEVATTLGFTKPKNNKGKNEVVFINPMPTETQVITDMLDKRVDYKLFSAMVHGHTWALQPLGFGKIAENQDGIDLLGGKYVEKSITFGTVEYLCVRTLICLFTPIMMKFRLFGWDSTAIHLAYKKAMREMENSKPDFSVT